MALVIGWTIQKKVQMHHFNLSQALIKIARYGLEEQ